MKKNPPSISKIYYLCILFAVSCLVFISMSVASRPKRNQDFDIRVINKTKSLQVKSAQKSTKLSIPTLEITLSNASSQNIMAYTIMLGDVGLATDYAFSEKLLAPGETEVKDIPMAGLEANAAKNRSLIIDVVISAVYFEDHTSEGDSKYVNMIKDKYVGIKSQTQYVLSILRKALDSPLPNTEQRLVEIESQASQLKTEDENISLSLDTRSGLRLVKENLNKKIRTLRSRENMTSLSDFKTEVQKLISSYEQLLARL